MGMITEHVSKFLYSYETEIAQNNTQTYFLLIFKKVIC